MYYGYQRFGKAAPVRRPRCRPTASTKPKVTNPIQKYIEVVGIRLTTDPKKKPIAKFVIINHASTELNNLGANRNSLGQYFAVGRGCCRVVNFQR